MTTLFGHGYIGSAIARKLEGKDFYWYSHYKCGIISKVIVNASGYTGFPNVDACETHKMETIEGNVLWPLDLERYGKYTPIIHITSGCVYDGFKSGGWKEEDEPNFTSSFYSLTKVLAQKYLSRDNYILRIRMPFGREWNSRNLLTKLAMYNRIVDCPPNSLTCIEDLAEVVEWFIENRPTPGIYNVCNPGWVTNRELVEAMGLKKELIGLDEFNKLVRVPRSFCNLNTDKLEKIFPMRPVKDALNDCINHLETLVAA